MKGSLAIVTGAARGIGQAIAKSLAASGATIVCVDLDDSADTCRDIAKDGGSAFSYNADLTNESQVSVLFDQIAHDHGTAAVLVNNAGFYAVPRRPFWEIDLAEWEKVITINLRSVFLCSRCASESMRREKKGRIVNISSDTVAFGMPNLMHYVAAKSAVVGMTRSMARELGPYGITVNAVAPGLVGTATAMESIGPEVLARVVQEQAIEQAIELDDVAEAVNFLCSGRARLISGQTLLLNGGANMSGI